MKAQEASPQNRPISASETTSAMLSTPEAATSMSGTLKAGSGPISRRPT